MVLLQVVTTLLLVQLISALVLTLHMMRCDRMMVLQKIIDSKDREVSELRRLLAQPNPFARKPGFTFGHKTE